MGKKRRRITPNYVDKRSLKYIKQAFPLEVANRLISVWSKDTTKTNRVLIGSLFKFSSSYYVSTDILYTPNELLRYIDHSEEDFFELRINTDGEQPFKFRFKVILRPIHKRWLIETLSSIRRNCRDDKVKAELRDKILRIRHSAVVPIEEDKDR